MSVVIDVGPDEEAQESGFMNATLQGAGNKVAFSISTSIDVPKDIIESGQDEIAKFIGDTLTAAASQFRCMSFRAMVGPSREAVCDAEREQLERGLDRSRC